MFKSPLSLYIHIPFCKKKCNYCDFYSVNLLTLEDDFINALEKEFEFRKVYFSSNIKTIYIGGGTPSSLSLKGLEKLFSILSKYVNLSSVKEITFEANPESINKEKLKLLRSFHVNRISLGIQSADDVELKFLGRIHTFDEFLRVYDAIRFDFVVNLDLIYGLPKQYFSDFKNSLTSIIKLKPHHISIYALEIHENTPFWNNITVDDSLQHELYLKSIEFLEDNGYIQYEISNFSIENNISLHNMNYWLRGNYLGFGPSASSCYEKTRWKNISDVASYINSINNGKIELEYIEELSYNDIMNEKLMLILRTRKGVEINSDIYLHFKNQIENAFKKGYFEIFNSCLRLKKEYIFVSNSIISEMIK